MLPFAAAFTLTMAVEVPLYVLALTAGWHLRWPRALTAGILVNAVTHPALWWFLHSQPELFLAAEATVCVVEWLLLMAFFRRADVLLLLLSIAANGASVVVGFMVLAGGF